MSANAGVWVLRAASTSANLASLLFTIGVPAGRRVKLLSIDFSSLPKATSTGVLAAAYVIVEGQAAGTYIYGDLPAVTATTDVLRYSKRWDEGLMLAASSGTASVSLYPKTVAGADGVFTSGGATADVAGVITYELI